MDYHNNNNKKDLDYILSKTYRRNELNIFFKKVKKMNTSDKNDLFPVPIVK